MPIEFYCPECDTFLRTPDSKAGLSAKCPACQENIWVPFESEYFDEDPFEDVDESAADSTQPLRRELPSEHRASAAAYEGVSGEAFSPESVYGADDAAGEYTTRRFDQVEFEESIICAYCGEVNHGEAVRCEACNEIFDRSGAQEITEVDLGDIFKVTWTLYSRHLGICILAILVDFLLTLGALIVVLIPTVMVMVSMQGNGDLAGPATVLVLFLGMGVCASVLWIGHYRFFLALARGERPSVNSMFHFGPVVGQMILATVAFSLMLILGLMACVIPGLIMIVLFWPFGRYLVDHECSAGEALVGTFQLCKRNFAASLFLMVFTLIIQTIASSLVVGMLFSVPFNAVLLTVAYLHFSGEYVTGDRA